MTLSRSLKYAVPALIAASLLVALPALAQTATDAATAAADMSATCAEVRVGIAGEAGAFERAHFFSLSSGRSLPRSALAQPGRYESKQLAFEGQGPPTIRIDRKNPGP